MIKLKKKSGIEINAATSRDSFWHADKEVSIFDSLLLSSISTKEITRLLSALVLETKKRGLSLNGLIDIYNEGAQEKQYLVPSSIFSTSLSPAESLVKFLKEEYSFNYHKIALLLKRDERGIWGSYNRAMKKMTQRFAVKDGVMIPVSVFSNRKMSILESVCLYMKDELNIGCNEIAKMMNKDISTIWTCYNRGKLKTKK